MRTLFASFALVLCLITIVSNARAAEDSSQRAVELFQAGKTDDAVALLSQALIADPKNVKLFKVRSRIYARLSEHAKAAADLMHVAELSDPAAYRHAGAEYFFAGDFAASIAAFDAVAKAVPEESAHLWERGISLYYAKRYAEGRHQFEDHKAVNPHDVENAAWHFICAAKEMGVEKARAKLLFIDTDQDTRVPMKQVYLLFKGEAQPSDVLAAANAGTPDADTLKNNLCYAHLYLGLYAEGLGDNAKAREHLEKAAVEFAQDHYMGQVARVHWALLKAQK